MAMFRLSLATCFQSKLAPSSSSAAGDAAEFSLDTTDSNTPGSCIPAIFTIIPAMEAIISGFFARLFSIPLRRSFPLLKYSSIITASMV